MNDSRTPSATSLQPAIEPTDAPYGLPSGGMRLRLYRIIFESDTAAGRRFDLLLIAAILVSILVVIIDSVHEYSVRLDGFLDALEWTFTALFTIEYVARLACVQRPLRYATSFFGIVDLLSVLPTYLAFFVPDLHMLIDVRILRLLRIFRILKLTLYLQEYQVLVNAVTASRRKIFVFLSIVLMVVLVMGTVMYVVEGPANGFTSIPQAMYWAVVTMTTVGYGDISPKTDIGRAIASIMMLIGWGVLAVPTGIVTAEMTSQRLFRLGSEGNAGNARNAADTRRCDACGGEGHETDARFCKDCGAKLPAGKQA
jgi:voltage-gated potassium channel